MSHSLLCFSNQIRYGIYTLPAPSRVSHFFVHPIQKNLGNSSYPLPNRTITELIPLGIGWPLDAIFEMLNMYDAWVCLWSRNSLEGYLIITRHTSMDKKDIELTRLRKQWKAYINIPIYFNRLRIRYNISICSKNYIVTILESPRMWILNITDRNPSLLFQK